MAAIKAPWRFEARRQNSHLSGTPRQHTAVAPSASACFRPMCGRSRAMPPFTVSWGDGATFASDQNGSLNANAAGATIEVSRDATATNIISG
jgi:hypothetical protein